MGRNLLVAALALAGLLAGAPAAAQQPKPAPEPPPAEPSAEPAPEPTTRQPEPVPGSKSTPIPPEPTPGITPAPGSPADPSTNEADKRIGVGIDALVVIPVGELGDLTGPSLGPIVRFGYRVIPALEIAMRAGYLFAVSKDYGAGVVGNLDIIPVWLFTRYFLSSPFIGPYIAVDVGMNHYLPTREPPLPGALGDAATRGRWRFGANVGAGYVLSTSFPVDIRAQVLFLNLAGQDDKLQEKQQVGIGIGAGYTLQF